MAAKATITDLKNAGFTPEMFAVGLPQWDGYLSALITDVSGRIAPRLGAAYDSADPVTAADVRRAEVLTCLAELWDRRITRKLGQVQSGAEPTTTRWEAEQRDRCLQEAADIIADITGTDYAGSTLETDNFSPEAPDA